MRCPACGLDNPPSLATCVACEQPLRNMCAACLAPLREDSATCEHCGHFVEAAAPSAARDTERRVVSILFADLVGFTRYAEEHDPEEVRDLLDAYFTQVRVAVGRYAGRIEKFIGDAVMAVWGAPRAREDDAERAVRAGLELVGSAAALGQRLGIAGLQVRAGVATGEAAVSSGLVGQGMIAGDVVNTAARLQSMAEPMSLVVDDPTRRATRLAVAYDDGGQVAVRNKRDPLHVWTAVGVLPGRRGEHSAQLLGPPLVGRSDELRALADIFAAVIAHRRAHLVTIVGRAGTGKTRLAGELQGRLAALAEETYWHVTSASPWGGDAPYAALANIVRERVGIEAGHTRTLAGERVRASVAELELSAPERRRVDRGLRALLGLPGRRPSDRDELFAAWLTFFERLAERHPLVLVFDDAQWADAGVLDFLDHLVAAPAAGRLMVVAVARPELLARQPRWARTSRDRSIVTVDALGDADMRRLVHELVPGLSHRLQRRMLERAEGLPLYAVELVRMLAERDELRRIDETLEVGGPMDDITVPDTIRALFAARLDSLEPPARALARDAAVLGPHLTLNALAAVSGQPRRALEPVLTELVHTQILGTDRRGGGRRDTSYRFVERGLQDVAYATLTRRDRRPRHVAAARYFESLEDPDMVAAIAGQVLAAVRTRPPEPEARPLRAWGLRALRAAARQAIELHAPQRALSHVTDALSICESPVDRAQLWEDAAVAAQAAARHDVAERFLRDAIAYHRRRRSKAKLVQLTVRLGDVLLMRYRVRDAVSLLRGSVARLGQRADDDPEIAPVMARLARAYSLRGERAEALAWSRRALDAARRHRLRGVEAEALMTMGANIAFGGDMRTGLRRMREAVSTAAGADMVVAAVRARTNLAATLLYSDPARALDETRAGLERARELGLRDFAVRLTSIGAGDAALDVGDWDWALSAVAALELEDLSVPDQVDLESVPILIGGWRGDADAADRLSALRERIAGDDRLAVAILAYRGAGLALAAGDARGALQDAHRAVRLLTAERRRDAATSLGWTAVARAATWIGDRAAVEAAASEMDHQPLGSRWWLATRETMAAGLAALDGKDSDARLLYARAARRWAALGVPFRRALCLLDQAIVTRGASAERAAARAEELFLELRALPFAELAHDAPRPAGTKRPQTRRARAGEPKRTSAAAGG